MVRSETFQTTLVQDRDKKYHSINGKMNGISYGNINGNIYLWKNPIEFPLSNGIQWDYFNGKQ